MKRRMFLFTGSAFFALSVTGCNSLSLEDVSSLDQKEDGKSFTVVWKNYDGTILEVDSQVEENTMPTYDGAAPVKSGNAQYSYSFTGWSPEITLATDDATYTAQFSETLNSYTVVWVNWDGTVLETDADVPYGATPSYDGTTPTKPSDAQYTYFFSSWSPNVSQVLGDIVYTAQYGRITNDYTVTWVNWDGTVLETDVEVPYGTIPVYNGTMPVKDGDAQHSFVFSGWSPYIASVSGDVTYTATFDIEVNKYTVTWANWDGTVLETDADVPYGATPAYNSGTPHRDSTAQYSYTFIGWSPEIVAVTGTTTYTAQFESIENKYSVTWANWDGTILETDVDVPYGTVPSYDGTVPTREDSFYSYGFAGWFPEESPVTGNVTYTAQFDSSAITYSIFYDLGGGIGDNPTSYSITSGNIRLAQPSKNGYEFVGWTGSNGDVPEKNVIVLCDSGDNLSYTAHWEALTYSITYHLFGGTNSNKNPSSYTTEDTLALGSPTKNGYDFNGWFLDSGFNEEITDLNGHYGDLELYANFSGKKFISSFEYQGLQAFRVNYVVESNHSLDRTIDFVEGDVIKVYDYCPSGTNIAFGGWYSDRALTNLVSSNTSITGSVTLYGKLLSSSDYIGDLFKIFSLYASGGESESKILYNPYLTYAFVQYSCKGSKGIQGGVGYSSSARVVITDTTTNTAVLNISSNDNTELDLINYGISLVPGHTYRALVVADNDRLNHREARASLYVKTVGNASTFVYDSSVEQTYESAALIPNLEERQGYDLSWCDNDGNAIHNTWDYLSDMSFHEVWTLHNYSIEYELNGGINDVSNPATYTLEDLVVLNAPQREGYAFEGWFSDSGFTSEVTVINGEDQKDYVLYAKWTPNTYVATLDYGGGKNCRVVNFYSQGGVIFSADLYDDSNLSYFIPDSPSPSMVFGGWYLDDAFTTQFSFDGTIDSDLSVYAKWISLSNHASLNPGSNTNVLINGNEYQYLTIVSPIDQSITITSFSALDLFGTVFDSNWNELISNDDASEENLDFSITIDVSAGNLYYLGYKANQKSVSGECIISLSGVSNPETSIAGDVVESVSVTYDSSFELPTPKKEGFVFVGWFDKNGNQIDIASWNYSESITIFARWTPAVS